jgi:hypothetical protein
MQQQPFFVVRPQLSSSNPNFSKPRNGTTNTDFWSRLTHQLLGRMKSTIPEFQIFLRKKKQILRSWGWGLTMHAGYFFEFADEEALGEG